MPEKKNRINETEIKNRTNEVIMESGIHEVEMKIREGAEAEVEDGIEEAGAEKGDVDAEIEDGVAEAEIVNGFDVVETENLIEGVEKESGVGEEGTGNETDEAETENGINEEKTVGVIDGEAIVGRNNEVGTEDRIHEAVIVNKINEAEIEDGIDEETTMDIIVEEETADETAEEEIGNKFKNAEIENNCKKTAKIYLEAARTAERVVAESYEDCVPGMRPSFPIDINLVALHYGIKVTSDELNQSRTQFSRVLALLICHEDDINVIVDNKVGYKTRRYAMANAIARYLLKDQGSVFTSSYAIPLIPQGLEEISADMVALFMLMPMQLFKEEFKDYIEKLGEHPMNVDKWLSHLSDRTQISPFNLAIGYQQMKTALCYERQLQLMENKYMDYDDDPYEMIFA